MNLVEKARKLAYEAHKGQFRKDGVTEYIEHPKQAYELAVANGIEDENILAAIWLHDVPEEKPEITLEEIAKKTNKEVARIVEAVTNDVGYDAYKERIEKSDYSVKVVKVMDTTVNCSDLTTNKSLKEGTIRRKVEDCKSTYLDMAKDVCPSVHGVMLKYVSPLLDRY